MMTAIKNWLKKECFFSILMDKFDHDPEEEDRFTNGEAILTGMFIVPLMLFITWLEANGN